MQITVYNTISTIDALSKDLYFRLREKFSYEKPGVNFYKNNFIPDHLKRVFLVEYDKTKKHYSFPTGILPYVLAELKENDAFFEIIDKRIKPETLENFWIQNAHQLPKLRYYQEEILNECEKHPRGIIEAATGTGKSLTILHLISKKSLPTIVLVPSKQILYQMAGQLEKSFGKKNVGIVGASKKQHKKIIVATPQSLVKCSDDEIADKKMVIIDEFHHSSAKTYTTLNQTKFKNIYYRYGFTATNFRNDGSDLSLMGVLSNTLYRYPTTKGISDGFLCKPVFCIYNHSHQNAQKYDEISLKIKRLNNSKEKYQAEINEFIIGNSDYNKKIVKIAKQMIEKERPTIIFVTKIEHGEILSKMLPEATFIFSKTKANNKIIEDFNAKRIPCLIGTSVIGEGVDTKIAACGIMADVGKAKSDIIQKVGRILRIDESKKFSMIIDFIHNGTIFCKNHSKKRISIYETYKSDVIYL